MATLQGIPVSAGISIGRALFLNRSGVGPLPRLTLPAAMIPTEVTRLHGAFGQFVREIEQARDRIPPELKEHALIIDSHLMILKDPKLSGVAQKYIETLAINAEWALDKAVDDLEKAFAALDDPYFRDRIQDVRTVAGRVQARLAGQSCELKAIENRVVLMAHDISPADTASLQTDKIMALVTVQGGKTSHTGILARTLGIPAVVGVTELEHKVRDGDLVVVDGLRGTIVLAPGEEQLAKLSDLKYQFEAYQAGIMRGCHLPGETIDGYRIKVKANIELLEEVPAVVNNGGEGIGLFRTEYSYMNRQKLPTEDELYEEYLDLATIMSPKRITLRTLDAGADKFVNTLGVLDERNPALGLRAIRLCMHHRDIFKTQLRAILRASVAGNISVMFPMISGLREIRQAKALMGECKAELRREGSRFETDMPVGIMMELPSAVMIAEILAREVDFFSIGTNDLCQYTLAVDRMNEKVSYLYQPFHPAVLRLIKNVIDVSHKAGKFTGMCGEMAGDPYAALLLAGLGIDELSMSPASIPAVKKLIRSVNQRDAEKIAASAMGLGSAEEIRAYCQEAVKELNMIRED
jgi:phosphotransferase system enzyme I (PtsI)